MNSFHWILFAIEIEWHRVWVYDSLRQSQEKYQDCIDLMNKAWSKYMKKHLKVKEDFGPLHIAKDFPV